MGVEEGVAVLLPSLSLYSMTQLVSVLPGLLMGTTLCTPVPRTAIGRSSLHAAGNQWEGRLKSKAAVSFSVSVKFIVASMHGHPMHWPA